MNAVGWLCNDFRRITPGVRTLWDDLIDWFDLNFIGDVHFPYLADKVEQHARVWGAPDYLVRNASYFRHIQIDCPQLSFMQDQTSNEAFRAVQVDVLSKTYPVFCSSYMAQRYPEVLDRPHAICPTGSDFSFWTPGEGDPRVLPDSICFCGPPTIQKGWDRLRELINNTPFNYCIISKDPVPELQDYPRVRVFVATPHEETRGLMRACVMGLCLSVTEAGHVSGQEMGAVGLPLVATPVAVYYGREDGDWGRCRAWGAPFVDTVREVMGASTLLFAPREYWKAEGFDLPEARTRWEQTIEDACRVYTERR